VTEPCTLCSQPLTIPLVEWPCPTCHSYARAHDGCQPGLGPDKAEMWAAIREAHRALTRDASGLLQSACERRRAREWNEARDALSERPLARYVDDSPPTDHTRPTKGMKGAS
jgi:hypothetical protein